MEQMVGKEGEKRLSKIGIEQMLVSMGHQASGAVTLWNYPSWMRNLVAHDVDGDDRPDPVDMSALESKTITNRPRRVFHITQDMPILSHSMSV